MFEELKREVCEANKMLARYGLVKLTWGNVSAVDRARRVIVIKPSGVDYEGLTPEKMVVVGFDGQVVEGDYRPSSDTPTHLVLYRGFPGIGGVVHTHSTFATAWAQANRDIPPLGTTQADYLFGDIPCTRRMIPEEIRGEYEEKTGEVILETFRQKRIDSGSMPAVLVANHGPFVWGGSAAEAVENSLILEEVAKMALLTKSVRPDGEIMQRELLEKHYFRKHGANAYYGQANR